MTPDRVEVIKNPELEKPVCKAWHWTTAAKWDDIRSLQVTVAENGELMRRAPGLWPMGEYAFFDWKSFSQVRMGPFISGFINSPFPDEWKRSKQDAELLKAFFQLKIGKTPAVISFDVFPSDGPLVAGELPTGNGGLRKMIVPMQEYQGNFDRPEILIPNYIHFERLSFGLDDWR